MGPCVIHGVISTSILSSDCLVEQLSEHLITRGIGVLLPGIGYDLALKMDGDTAVQQQQR